MAAAPQDDQPWQQLTLACWSRVLCRSYFLIKNLGSSILLHLKKISDREFSGKSPDVVFCGKNFGSFLYSLKIKEKKPYHWEQWHLSAPFCRLLNSAELLSAKWANLKDTFSPISFKNLVSLDMLKNAGKKRSSCLSPLTPQLYRIPYYFISAVAFPNVAIHIQSFSFRQMVAFLPYCLIIPINLFLNLTFQFLLSLF